MDAEKVLVVEGLSTVDDVKEVEKRAIAENYAKYVAVSHTGQRFAVVDGAVVKLGDDEVGVNVKYHEPVVEEVVEVVEDKNEEVSVKLEEVAEVKEEGKELTDEEIAEQNLKLAQYDILVAKNQELETKNIELNNEIAKLNEQIDTLTIKAETPVAEPVAEITLEDVVEFLKNHEIHTLGV